MVQIRNHQLALGYSASWTPAAHAADARIYVLECEWPRELGLIQIAEQSSIGNQRDLRWPVGDLNTQMLLTYRASRILESLAICLLFFSVV